MTDFLYRQSVFCFGAMLLLVAWAFWPTYFSRVPSLADPYLHAHAMSQTLWCVLLVVQAYAIRTDRRWIHRYLGAVSPLLVLLVCGSTLAFMHHRMRGLFVTDWLLQSFAFNFTSLAAFAALYALAHYHRHDPFVHARFVMCTALPFFTAFGPGLIQTSPLLVHLSIQAFGRYGASIGQAALIPADIAAIALSAWDWRSRRRLNVFPVALMLLLSVHLSVVALYKLPFWTWAVEWFVSSP